MIKEIGIMCLGFLIGSFWTRWAYRRMINDGKLWRKHTLRKRKLLYGVRKFPQTPNLGWWDQ